MDRDEYAALCALRDGVHEDLKLKLLALQSRYAGLIEVNSEQTARLARLTIETEHLRTRTAAAEKRSREAAARMDFMVIENASAKTAISEKDAANAELARINQHLEALLPARSGVQQPAFAKGSK